MARFIVTTVPLPCVERTTGGIRMFKESDLEFLNIIHCLKQAGVSISGIREFLTLVKQGDTSIDARLAELTCSTVHRMLGIKGAGRRPEFDQDSPLPYDLIVIDESHNFRKDLGTARLCMVVIFKHERCGAIAND